MDWLIENHSVLFWSKHEANICFSDVRNAILSCFTLTVTTFHKLLIISNHAIFPIIFSGMLICACLHMSVSVCALYMLCFNQSVWVSYINYTITLLSLYYPLQSYSMRNMTMRSPYIHYSKLQLIPWRYTYTYNSSSNSSSSSGGSSSSSLLTVNVRGARHKW